MSSPRRTRPQPTDAYGRTKLEAERLVAESGVPFTVLRPAVVYGKGVKGNIAALATLAKTPMPLPSPASTIAARCSRSTISSRRSRSCSAPSRRPNETFLVADAEPISVAEHRRRHARGAWPLPASRHACRSARVKRLMKSFGKEAEWERISGNFVIDASKLDGHRLAARGRDP